MPKSLNILQLTSSSDIGGAENIVFNIITHCDNRFNFVLACLQGSGLLLQRAALADVPAYRLNIRRLWALYRGLNEIIRVHKIDMIQTHGITAQVVAVPIALKHHIPLIATLHGLNDFHNKIKALLARLSRRYVHLFVSVTETGKKTLMDRFQVPEEKISVIYNGININTPQVSRKKDPSQPLQALTVANLKPVKGHETIIQAARLLHNSDTDIRFSFVGRDDSNGRLQRLVRQYHLEEVIHFEEFQNNLQSFYQQADLFILPSYSEGLPVSILEAMLYGLPVIATTVGGLPGVIENKINGLLIAPGDPQALYQAIQRLQTDPALRSNLGRNARETVRDRYSLREMITRYESLFQTIGNQTYKTKKSQNQE